MRTALLNHFKECNRNRDRLKAAGYDVWVDNKIRLNVVFWGTEPRKPWVDFPKKTYIFDNEIHAAAVLLDGSEDKKVYEV